MFLHLDDNEDEVDEAAEALLKKKVRDLMERIKEEDNSDDYDSRLHLNGY